VLGNAAALSKKVILLGAAGLVVTVADVPAVPDVPTVAVMPVASVALLLGMNEVCSVPVDVVTPEVGVSVEVNPVLG
jgi:hypothetical protein